MATPRKNSSPSCRYKGLVDAKVPTKRNCYREDSANQHFLSARVAIERNFWQSLKKSAVCIPEMT